MAIDIAKAFQDYVESDGEIDFDLYAQDTRDWTWLQEFIPGILISSAGGLLPFQAEGLLEGHPFYYRDRHGWASLSVGSPDGEKPYLGESTYYGAGCETPEFEGREHFIKNLIKLVKELKPTAFPYEFQGKKVLWEEGNRLEYTLSETETDRRCAWGDSPEEAFEELKKPSEYLLSRGWSEEFQRKLREAQEFSPIPVRTDERVYPETPVVFRVNV